jgi:CHASE3 domain sensor protein
LNLTHLTIKGRLIAGFSALAVIVLVVSAISLNALSRTTEGFSGYVHGISARADIAAQVRTAVDRRAIAARNLVLVTKPSDIEMEKAAVLQAHEDVQVKLKQLNDMIATATDTSEKARSLVAEIGRVETLYGPVATTIVNLALAGKHDEAIQMMDDQCRPLLAQLVKATDDYAGYTREREDQMVIDYGNRYQDERNLLIAICVGALGLALGLGLYITRSITAPIQRAVDVAMTKPASCWARLPT